MRHYLITKEFSVVNRNCPTHISHCLTYEPPTYSTFMPLLPPYHSQNYPQNTPLELTSKQPPDRFFHAYSENLATIMLVEEEQSKYRYPMQITNMLERESWTVSTDHCYARPWNWKPESTFLKPTKVLFVPKNVTYKPLFSVLGSPRNVDDIDLEDVIEPSGPSYDLDAARELMGECERHASLARNSIDDENWEERINKVNWSHSQHRLFNGFVNILNNFYLGKMAYFGLKNEPVLRRALIDKAVQRVRRLFNSISYEVKLLQWIHQLLLDNLDQQNLSSYLDILQTLKSKIPKFAEHILNTPSSANRMGPLNNENLLPLLKRPWDPVEASLAQDNPKKLPSNPILVLMPCAPNMTKRNYKWLTLLSNLGQVVSVPNNFGSSSHRLTMTNCIDQMFSVTRGRIQEVKENYPGRHIILVGFGAGATLALQVAQVENIFCVVSLGFSLLTAEGRRGEPDDGLLELQCPVLFVVGQCSSTSFQEDMEDLRERMRIETGLIVVGSADNNLIVSKKKRREEGITQSIVDRCIIDEIGEFIGSLILSPYPPQTRQSPTFNAETPKKAKLERKRYNSNTSSVESEPPSPTPRLTRPVGRPAGKTKCKLEAKWAAQVAQGTNLTATPSTPNLPSSLPPSPLIPSDNVTGVSPCTSDTASATESPLRHNSPRKSEGSGRKGRPRKHPLKTDKGEQGVKPSDQARMQAYNLGRNVMPAGQLSSLLQGGIKTIPPVQQKLAGSTSTTIKILENVQLTSQATAKLISNTTGRTIDLSKIGLGQRSTGGNVVLMPDGKIKPITLKTNGGTPIVLSVSGASGTTQRPKFLTTKRLQSPKQLPVKKSSFAAFPPPIKTSLPPPTNLTSQDIMDLPIIFADDDQVLDPNMPTDLSTTATVSEPELKSPAKFVPSTSKFVIINKPTTPASGFSNFIINSGGVKRPNPVPVAKQPTKYTKIILSKKSMEPFVERTASTSYSLSNQRSEIITTTDNAIKRIDEQMLTEDDDPDYVPPKNLKL